MFFLQLYYIFLRFKRVETFIGGGGGGGGAAFYLFFFFFWGGGGGFGGGGVQILISIETYKTCDFSGGGGGSGPPIPLWIRAWVRNK